MGIGWFSDKCKFRIKFDFTNEYGVTVHTDLDNNGTGYGLQDALDIQRQLKQQGKWNVTVEQITAQKVREHDYKVLRKTPWYKM